MSREKGKGVFNLFTKCVPCFRPEQAEQYDRMNRSDESGDGNSTPRTRVVQRSSSTDTVVEDNSSSTPRRREGSLKRSQDTTSSRGGGVVVASSSSSGGGVVATTSSSSSSSKNKEIAEEALFWTREFDRHYSGNFSVAVMQANKNLEDYSQVEVARTATFVGVYDGHGGHQTAQFVRENFTEHLMGNVRQTETMSVNCLEHAFRRTEDTWLDRVNAEFEDQKLVAGYGTCCLVGVIWRGNIYVANVGDSRAIIARSVDGSDEIAVEQLTRDDNVNDPVVRAEVLAIHDNDPDIIVKEDAGVYRIKGRIQVSRSIGDAYLKRARFNIDDVNDKYRLKTPLRGRAALSAEPSTIRTIAIQAQDRFLIFASDGLWDLMSNQDAADFVHSHPKEGIAASLITAGLTKRAEKLGGTYEELLTYRRDSGLRRRIHDDISVVVIFFNHALQEADIQEDFPKYSIREGSVSTEGDSNFTALDELA